MDKFSIEEDWVDIAPSSTSQKEKESTKRREDEDLALEDSIRKSLGGMGARQKTDQIQSGNPFASSVLSVKEPTEGIARILPKDSVPVVIPDAEPVSPSESDEEDLKSSILGNTNQEEPKEEVVTVLEKQEEQLTVDKNSSFGKSLTSSVFSPEGVRSAETAWNLSQSSLPHFSDEEEPKVNEEKGNSMRERKEEVLLNTLPIKEPSIELTKKEEAINEDVKKIDPIFGELQSNGVTALPYRDMELFIITGSLLTMVLHSFLFSPQCLAF